MADSVHLCSLTMSAKSGRTSAAWNSVCVLAVIIARLARYAESRSTHLDSPRGLVPQLVEFIRVLDRFVREGEVQQRDVDLGSAQHASCFVKSRVVLARGAERHCGSGAWAEREAGGKISNSPGPAGVKNAATHHLADEDHAEDEGA